MAIALQWHVASNVPSLAPFAIANATTAVPAKARTGDLVDTSIAATTETLPVVRATARTRAWNAESDFVLLVLSEPNQRQSHAADHIAASTQTDTIFESCHRALTSISTFSEEDVARRFDDAVATALMNGGETNPCVIAALVWHRQLFVVRTRGGHAFLLRRGDVQHLTLDSEWHGQPLPESAARHACIETEIGQLDLQSDDRVLLCTHASVNVLSLSDIKRWLHHDPSCRRTTQLLLRAITREQSQQSEARAIGIAVLDFIGSTTTRLGTRSQHRDFKVGNSGSARLSTTLSRFVRRNADRLLPLLAIAGAAAMTSTLLVIHGTGNGTDNTTSTLPTGSAHTTMLSTPTPTLGVGSPSTVASVSTVAAVAPVIPAAANVNSRAHMSGVPVVLPPQRAPINMPALPTRSSPRTNAAIDLSTQRLEDVPLATAAPPSRPTIAPTTVPTPWLELQPKNVTVVQGEVVTLRVVYHTVNGATPQGPVAWSPAEKFTIEDAYTAQFAADEAGTFTVTASISGVQTTTQIFVLVPLSQAQESESLDAGTLVSATVVPGFGVTATVLPELPDTSVDGAADGASDTIPAPTLDATTPPPINPARQVIAP
jgi:hypothetical protein